MNTLLTIAGLLVAVVALLLIVAGFADKDYTISRDILIRENRDNVFDYIRNLKNQDHYSKWVMADPDMAKNYRGTDGRWNMTGRNPYPMNLMHMLMKGVLIKDMDASLVNLKRILEDDK